MAFIIALSETYRVKVTVETLNEAGKKEKSEFHVVFKRYDVDELDELRTKPQREVLKEAIVGWEGLLDGNKEPVPFNELNVDVLLRITPALQGLALAFWNSIVTAREKN